MKISIIVPIYNTEKYVEDCIRSVQNQTYSDFELILVDDGSSDSSGSICDRYAVDSRIKVVHKPNGGVSSARNLGLKEATGDWLMFLDSDDTIDADCLNQCLQKCVDDNLDMLQFYNTRFGIDKHNIGKHNMPLSSNDFLKIRHNVCIGGSFIKREIIIKNNIVFDDNLRLAEDQIFILKCIHCSKRIEIIDKILYMYRLHRGNTTCQSNSQSIENSCSILIDYKKTMPYAVNQLDNTMLSFVGDLIRLSETPRQRIETIYKSANIKHCDKVTKSNKIFFYLSLINFNVAFFVLKKYLIKRYE